MRKLLGTAALVLISALGATPAMALTTGECLPAQQVRDALASEGQKPIIVGTRTGYGYPTSLIFFANSDGSRGYLIRGDKPLGQQSATACVDSVYRDVHLNDIAQPGIPDWAKVLVRQREVEATCRGHLGYQDDCRPFTVMLSNMEANGAHVMFGATGTAINPRDHSIRTDQRIILNVEGSRKGGLLTAVTGDGAGYLLTAYTDASFTQNATGLLGR